MPTQVFPRLIKGMGGRPADADADQPIPQAGEPIFAADRKIPMVPKGIHFQVRSMFGQ